MIVVYGIKHFAPRRMAFRNDFCLSCEAHRTSVQVRTFDMLHIFWIPLIPLGRWRRWFCATCGKRPHATTRTRRSFKIAGAVIVALMALSMWAVPAEGEDAMLIWALRAGLPALVLLAVWSAVSHRVGPDLKAQLEALPPADDVVCPFCATTLFQESGGAWCPSCGVRRV